MICHVTVRTARLYETVDFYQWLLGLPVSRKLKIPSGEIIFLGKDETKFELIEDNKAEKINAKGLTVGFQVDNLDEKISLLDSYCPCSLCPQVSWNGMGTTCRWGRTL